MCFQRLVIQLPFLLSKNNIQQVFQKFHVLLKEEFSPEDVQIIACPSMEQVGNLCYFYNLLVILLEQIGSFELPYFVVIFKIVHYSDEHCQMCSPMFGSGVQIFSCFFFVFWPHFVAHGVLVPQPGIKPGPLPWKHGVLTTGPPGKSPQLPFNAF